MRTWASGRSAALETEVVAVGDGTATIGIGSLDGLPSSLAGRVMVSTPQGRRPLVDVGRYASTIGEWAAARVGDLVTVYGDADSGAMSATDLAETIGTIGEEIALRVSPLVPRNLPLTSDQTDSSRRAVSSCQLVAIERSFSSYLRPW